MQNFYQVTPVLTADSMATDRRRMCTGLEAAVKSDGIFYSSIPQITSLLRALPKLLGFFSSQKLTSPSENHQEDACMFMLRATEAAQASHLQLKAIMLSSPSTVWRATSL